MHAAISALGEEQLKRRNEWSDKECEENVECKNEACSKLIQNWTARRPGKI